MRQPSRVVMICFNVKIGSNRSSPPGMMDDSDVPTPKVSTVRLVQLCSDGNLGSYYSQNLLRTFPMQQFADGRKTPISF